MLQTIIKFSIGFGLFLTLASFVKYIPILNIYFDSSVESAIRFISMGTVMLFGLNSYLKKYNTSKTYNYGVGFTIDFSIGFFGVILYLLLLTAISFLIHGTTVSLGGLFSAIGLHLPMVLLLSIIIPHTFRNKKGKNQIDREMLKEENILDSEIK